MDDPHRAGTARSTSSGNGRGVTKTPQHDSPRNPPLAPDMLMWALSGVAVIIGARATACEKIAGSAQADRRRSPPSRPTVMAWFGATARADG